MRVLRALWGSTHPGPTLVVTALSLALGLAAGLEAWRLALLVGAVFSGQVSIGLSNDAIDAGRDEEVGRADKPIAAGVVSATAAMAVAVVAAIVALALSAPLGAGMVAAHAVLLAGGWAYNAGVKATALSVVPFLVSFGLFPSLATLALPGGSIAPPWASVAGAALGAAVHLTNVLPDLDDDRATGIRGLPHRIGPRASAVIAAIGVVAGAVAVLVGSSDAALQRVSPVGWLFFAAAVAAAAGTVLRVIARPPDRTVFRLVMLAALLLSAQLVATGSALTA